MMLLSDLKSTPRSPVLLLSCGAQCTRGDLLAWANSVKVGDWLNNFKGAKVGLCCRDNEYLALALLLLDGVAKRITLLPQGLNTNDLASIAQNSEITHLISEYMDAAPEGLILADQIPEFFQTDTNSNFNSHQTEFTTEWVIPTSGTTRQPKLVAHTVETLSRSVKRDPLKGKDICWGLLYDLNRFAGIQVFLQAVLGGANLCITNSDLSLEDRISLFIKAKCNALSATPTLWRKILMTPGAKSLPLKFITLGGEIADQSILSALKMAFPKARITHIYASTEAGVGFSVTDGLEGFPSSYLTGGLPGVDLRISDDILEIKPAIQGQKYLSEQDSLTQDDGFVNTGDRVRLENNRVFFLGRDSGAINVGGNKVQPEKIEQTILSHPEVAMASVVAKKSGITGALVEARVVMKSKHEKSPVPMLREWCAERLERYEVPAIFRVMDDIDMNSTGKISRQ